jgi:hypothetical protein
VFAIVELPDPPITIPGGDELAIQIEFKPRRAGYYQDELVVLSGDPARVVLSVPLQALQVPKQLRGRKDEG